MRFPVVKGPLGCKRLREGDVLPDIAEVSEVRVRHARTSLRSRSDFPPLPGSSGSRGPVFGNVTRTGGHTPRVGGRCESDPPGLDPEGTSLRTARLRLLPLTSRDESD